MVINLRFCLLLVLAVFTTFTANAQDLRASRAVPASSPSADVAVAVADIDNDGLADAILVDLDGDNLVDIVPLSRSRTRHDTVKNSINNVRRTPAGEMEIGDLDGDGRPEIALLAGSAQARSLNDSKRSLLSVVRRELANGQPKGVAELVSLGWLDNGATGGDPLSHVIAGGPSVGGSSAPIPVPYPDPENNPNGSSNNGGGNTGGGGGGGFSTSTGNEAGTASGIITRKPLLGPGSFNPG